MMRIVKAVAGNAETGPALVHAREAARVERDRARRELARRPVAGVQDDERDERAERQGEPPSRERARRRPPADEQRDHDGGEPRAREQVVATQEPRDRCLAGGEPFGVPRARLRAHDGTAMRGRSGCGR
jgi:hypothetical protein